MAGDEMKVSPIQSDRTPWQRRSVEKPAPERGSHRRIMRQSNAGGQAAKHPTKAAFVMGYAQRHQWPHGEQWSLVVTFCDYPKAIQAGQAIGLLNRKPVRKRAKKKSSQPTQTHASKKEVHPRSV